MDNNLPHYSLLIQQDTYQMDTAAITETPPNDDQRVVNFFIGFDRIYSKTDDLDVIKNQPCLEHQKLFVYKGFTPHQVLQENHPNVVFKQTEVSAPQNEETIEKVKPIEKQNKTSSKQQKKRNFSDKSRNEETFIAKYPHRCNGKKDLKCCQHVWDIDNTIQKYKNFFYLDNSSNRNCAYCESPIQFLFEGSFVSSGEISKIDNQLNENRYQELAEKINKTQKEFQEFEKLKKKIEKKKTRKPYSKRKPKKKGFDFDELVDQFEVLFEE